MPHTSSLLCKAIIIETMVVVISVYILGAIYGGTDAADSIIATIFIPLLAGVIPSFLIAKIIEKYIKLTSKNAIIGVLLFFALTFISVNIGAIVFSFLEDGSWIDRHHLYEIQTAFFYFCGIQTLGIAIWLGIKLDKIKQSSKN